MTLNPLLSIMYEPIVRTALLEDLGVFRVGQVSGDLGVGAPARHGEEHLLLARRQRIGGLGRRGRRGRRERGSA